MATFEGTNADETLTGGVDDDTLIGLGGDDTLFGNGGNDTFWADFDEALGDEMYGGAGIDTLYTDYGLSLGPDAIIDSVETIVGNGNSIWFSGSGTFDLSSVTSHVDLDYYEGDSASQTIVTGLPDDEIWAGDGDDEVRAGAGDDTLVGEGGDDALYGEGGDDVFVVDFDEALGDALYGGDGEDTIETGYGFTLGAGAVVDSIETIIGNGNSIWFSGSGTFDLSAVTSSIDLDAYEGDSASQTIVTGLPDDEIWAGDGNDEVRAGAGDDTLVGEGGDDALYGDDGDDVFLIDFDEALGDSLYGGDGEDTIETGYGFTLGVGAVVDSIETIIANGNSIWFSGSGTFDLSGVASLVDVDYYQGDSASQTIVTGLPDDEIWAGDGDDEVRAGDGDDTLVGESGDDALFGEDGDDVFIVDFDEAVGDSLYGGVGEDAIETDYGFTLGVGAIVDGIETISANGNSIGFSGAGTFDLSSVTSHVDLEYYEADASSQTIVTGLPNDEIWAGDGDDEVLAGAGDDILIGEGGDDLLHGEDGDDRMIVSGSDGQRDQFYGGEGIDTLELDGDVRLRANAVLDSIERIEGGDDAIDLVGAGVFDFSGVQTLEDVAGYFGDRKAQTVLGGAADELIFGGAGADILKGGAGDDEIHGGEKQGNRMQGQAGDDLLVASAHKDLMIGGGGLDTFRFDDLASDRKKTQFTVKDFDVGLESLDLSGLLDSGRLLSGRKFKGKDGDMLFKNGKLLGDVDGDKKVDFQIKLVGVEELNIDDLVF